MRITAPTVLLLASVGCPALALDFGNGFSLTGEVELEYIDFADDSDAALWVDVTLGWRSQGGGAIGVGFDLGVDGFANLDGGDSRGVFWGGLVVTTAAGDLTVGAARPVLADIYDLPKLGGSTLVTLELRSATGPIAGALAVLGDEQLYGVSFKGSSGNLTYGISYNEPEDEPLSFLEAGVTYRIGNSLLKAGIETIGIGGIDLTLVSLGATHDFQRLSLGVHLTELVDGPSDVSNVQVFGSYQVTDALTVEAMVQDIDGSGTSIRGYGVSGEYSFGGAFARLGAASIDGFGTDDTLLDAAVGFRF